MSFVSTATQTAPSIVICMGDNAFANTFYMEVNATGVGCGGFDTRRLPELLAEFGGECDLYYALLVLIESCVEELAPTLPTAGAYVPRATAGWDALDEDTAGYFLNELDEATEFAPAEQLNQVTIHGYSTNVLRVLGCETPGDELVFGLELETSDDNCDVYPLAATRKGIWKEDSSCGLEFVTKPMSIAELLDFAHNAPVSTLSPDSSCGMHLHINRRALTQRQVCLLALLISSEEYAEQIDQIAGRRSNDFCKKVKKTEDEVLHTCDRYEAVNLTNYSESKYTVEIRIFAGTRYNHHLVERVLWVYKLVQFVKSPFASADYGDFLKYQQKLSGFVKHLVK